MKPGRRSPVVQVHSFALTAERQNRFVLIADTHGRPHPNLGCLLDREHPIAILHAGDVGDPSVLEALRLKAPVLAVRGNIDTHAPDLPDVAVVHIESGAHTVFCIVLVHIGLYSVTLRREVRRLAEEHQADLVVCGHSHVPFAGVDRGLPVLNPGAAGPKRFRLPATFAVIELVDGAMQLRHVDCDTGNVWIPPRDAHA